MNALKNKRILITAGPTWVPIDIVRVISNVASGQTGILLAKRFRRLGAKVTLLLGPMFFDQLRAAVKKELTTRSYDIIIHSAAVSDFGPVAYKGKIDSARPITLKLYPLPKIIKDMRRLAPKAKLVMFKLEAGVSDSLLSRRAMKAGEEAGADIVVANSLDPYRAFIIDKAGSIMKVRNKRELAKEILRSLRGAQRRSNLRCDCFARHKAFAGSQ